jgi:hypothetical protein
MSAYDNNFHQSTQAAEHYDKIPEQMKKQRAWVRYRVEDRKGKLAKIPLNPRNGHPASSTDPSTWGTYKEAVASRIGTGIGFVFTPEAGIVGIDLDHIIHDGVIEPWAEEIIREINSYTERSPSHKGVHIYCFVSFPFNGRKNGQFECYGHGRYFTVTGDHLPGTPLTIEQRSESFHAIYDRIFGKHKQPADYRGSSKFRADLSNEEIIGKASSAANGGKFARLWNGDWQGFYPSQSEADAALCSILAFYLGQDPERIDQLFRNSGLMRPKWNKKHYGDGCTYGQMTISRVLARNAEGEPVSGSTGKVGTIPSLNASDGNLERITNAAWEALHASNHPPQLFRQGNLLVRIEKDSRGGPIFRELTLDRTVNHLSRAARWYKTTNEGQKDAWPPKGVARNILATPDPLLPVVERVIEAPFFAPNYSLQIVPGYCPDARVYYAPPEGFRIPETPRNPSRNDIEKAIQLLEIELLGDFPFVDDSDRTHALALLIQPFCRNIIYGPTPLHLIEKPAPGTGASLMAEVLFCPAMGSPIATMSEGRDEDEWRKRITAKLLSGPSAVLIDNLRRRLDSAALSAVITSSLWEDRILGRSETIKLSVACAWAATGNNPALSNEMVRRTIRIRLDAMTDQPWLRNEFRHPDLREWAGNNRPHLVWAALTLIQNWIAAGRPLSKSSSTLGMFESWSGVMGGIMECAGISGFLGNIMDFYEKADTEGAIFRQFVCAWWQRYGGSEVAVSELWELVSKADITLPIGDGNERSQRTRLGILLSRNRDRQFDGLRITEGEGRQGAKTWKLVESVRR